MLQVEFRKVDFTRFVWQRFEIEFCHRVLATVLTVLNCGRFVEFFDKNLAIQFE
jgi:hypothetical protein